MEHEHALTEQRISANLSWITDLYRLGHKISQHPPSPQVLGDIVRHMVQAFDARSGTLALLEPEQGVLRIAAGLALPEGVLGSTIELGDGILGAVAAQGKPLLLAGDLSEDEDFGPLTQGRRSPRPASALCWPLRADDHVIGALSLNRYAESTPFTEQDLADGQILIDLLSLVLDNTRLYQQYQNQIDSLTKVNTALQQSNDKLHEMSKQLLQSEKMAAIGQLAAGVAHEINNPVGYIQSNLSSLHEYVDNVLELLTAYGELEQEAPAEGAARQKVEQLKKDFDLTYLKEDLQDLVDESQEGVKRVRQIVQDLKDFSRTDSGEWECADLHTGIKSTLNIVHNELKYKASVVQEFSELPLVRCIPSQLNQVFMNLLVNAGHAIEERGTVTVRTGREGDEWVWVEVEDTGKGIDAEHLEKIFEPFFTTKPVGKGTGLGLSLAAKIIRKHGGKLDVRSEVGKGTCFHVSLPVNQPETSAADAEEDAAVEAT